jgi:hypothetical protein
MATPDLSAGATRVPRISPPRKRRRPRTVAEWIILVIAIIIALVILAPFAP